MVDDNVAMEFNEVIECLEYLFLDTHHLVDITLLEELNTNVIDIAYIALLQTEL